jgi:hypothetical protein
MLKDCIRVQVSTNTSREAKKWLLNERKRQQQEDDKSKKSSDTNGNYALKLSERKKHTSSNMPNQ